MRSAALASAVLVACIFMCVQAAPIILDGSKHGRKFDGVGGLSGGGATSRFIFSYKEPHRSNMLDYLFKPNFAASLQILKVEIGGDGQTTEGTESSHMHNRTDLNYKRGYEWSLMVEAKKRNPDIILYALSWSAPGWVGSVADGFYTQDNIDYHVKWLEGAKSEYGLKIDYIGIWNERDIPTKSLWWISGLRHAMDKAGFNETKIVAADGGWGIVDQVHNNSTLMKSIDVFGAHYPGTVTTESALNTNKTLWASEDYSTYADDVGGGCWARILNQNYVNGHMTATISWNLIASYYNNVPWPNAGLMSAAYPWTGYYSVPSPIWVSAHTTQFTKPGDLYLAHGSGVGKLPKGGSYVTLVPASNKNGDFTIVIETMSHDHSICVRPNLPAYDIAKQNVTFQIAEGLQQTTALNIWYTHLGNGEKSTYFEQVKSVTPVRGEFTLELEVDSVWTISTLKGQKKGTYPPPPNPAPFPSTFSDDFESYAIDSQPTYFDDQTGVFEVIQGKSSKVLRQQVTERVVEWCWAAAGPVTLIGPFSATDMQCTVDVLIETAGSVSVGARVETGGCWTDSYKLGYFFTVNSTGHWQISGRTVLRTGTIDVKVGSEFTIEFSVRKQEICAGITGLLKTVCVNDTAFTNGFMALGTGYNHVQFDNFKMQSEVPLCGTGNIPKVQDCTGENNQKWMLKPDGTIKSQTNESLCLDASASNEVSLQPCTGKNNQKWRYDGQQIHSESNATSCLHNLKQSDANCALVGLSKCAVQSDNWWYYVWTYDTETMVLMSAPHLGCLTAAA